MTTLREIPCPLVIAHRGASAVFIENSVDAFVGAATLGADWVELDVRVSSDGTPVVHHDPHLPASDSTTSTSRLVVADTPFAAFPVHVPTLVNALTACEQPGARSGRPLGVNVEIKSAAHEPGFDPSYAHLPAILAIVTEILGPDRALISSFDLGVLRRVRQLAPDLPTALLAIDCLDLPKVLRVASAAGSRAINPPDVYITPTFMDAARAAGLAVYPWTVDRPERISELCDLGVDGIITNVPDVAATIIDARA